MTEVVLEIERRKFPGLREKLEKFGFRSFGIDKHVLQDGTVTRRLLATVTITGPDREKEVKHSTVEGILAACIGPTRLDVKETEAGLSAKTILELKPTAGGETKHTMVFAERSPEKEFTVKPGKPFAYFYKINSNKRGVGTHAIEIHVPLRPKLSDIIKGKIDPKKILLTKKFGGVG